MIKFKHYTLKTTFDTDLKAGNIKANDLVFIKDKKLIYTHGLYYSEAPNNNKITIQKNGTDIDSFTLNQNSDKTINIEVPAVNNAAVTLFNSDGTTKAGSFTLNQSTAANITLNKTTVGLSNVLNTAFYKRMTTINGTDWAMAGTINNVAFTIYAPITAGTKGQYLISSGATPSWGSLGIATADIVGGVKSSTTGTTADRDYKVQVNSDGTMKVNVPWVNTNTNTTYSIAKSGSTVTLTGSDGSTSTFTDANSTYSNFVKSGSSAKAGLVPAPPTTAGTAKYLREDGTWADPPDTNTTYSAGTGLSLTGTTFSANFGGNGTAATVSHSDHTHSYAPINHASTTTNYGIATETKYGHVKILDRVEESNVDETLTSRAVHELFNYITHFPTTFDLTDWIAGPTVQATCSGIFTNNKYAVISLSHKEPILLEITPTIDTSTASYFYCTSNFVQGINYGSPIMPNDEVSIGFMDSRLLLNVNYGSTITFVIRTFTRNSYKGSGYTPTVDSTVTPSNLIQQKICLGKYLKFITISDNGYPHFNQYLFFGNGRYKQPVKITGNLATDDLVGTNGTKGLIKNGSTITSTTGLTASPIISGIPYYRNTTYSVFTGATTSADGSSGLVPQPLIADRLKFLRADKTWTTITPSLIGAATSSHTHNYLPINNPTFTGTMTGPKYVVKDDTSSTEGATMIYNKSTGFLEIDVI